MFEPIINEIQDFDINEQIKNSFMDLNENNYAFLVGRKGEYNIYHYYIKPKTLCIYKVKDYQTKKGAFDIKKMTDRVKIVEGVLYRFDKIKKKWFKILPNSKGSSIITIREYWFKYFFNKKLEKSKQRITHLLQEWNQNQGENMKNKEGFTLIELLITLVLTTIIGVASFKYKLDQKYNNDINKMNSKINAILNYAVMDTSNGYINGSGGDCSDDNTYKKLTAGRAIKCIGWDDKPYKLDGDDDDHSDSNIYALLPTHTANGKGCKMYLKEKSDDEYYFFVDCSSMDKDRKKQLFEQMLNYDINSNFSTIIEDSYFDAKDIDHTTGGDDKDGKIMFLMKK